MSVHGGPAAGRSGTPADEDTLSADDVRAYRSRPESRTARGSSGARGAERRGDRPSMPAPGLAAVVAVLAVVTLELVRSSGPLLDMAFAVGVVPAAGAALVTYALPGPVAALLLVLARPARERADVGAVIGGTLAVAVLRAALPLLSGGVRFVVGLLAVALALAVLTLAVSACARARGGPLTLRAVATGLAIGVGVQLALGTWDAVWRRDVAGWVVTVLVVGALVLAAARLRTEAAAGPVDAAPPAHVRRLWTLGLLLGLAAMILANPAWAASQSGVPLAVAGPVTGAGLLLTAWLVGLESAPRRGWPAWAESADTVRPWVDGGVLTVVTLGIVVLTGPVVLVLLAALQLVAVQQAGLALRAADRPAGALRSARSATAAGLAAILPLLVFQLDYDVPLGFPNVLVVVAAAAALGVGGIHLATPPDRRHVERRPGLPAAVSTAAVLVGTVVVVTSAVAADRASAAGADPRAAAAHVTVVSWNLHYGVTPGGHVALEHVARTIEEQDACVVLLQEASRGWVLGGGTDTATWLAHRLGMRLSFAPAADRQFGNAVLTCTPHRDVVVHDLPYGVGPQQRSAISATVDLGGRDQRYTSVHLQHRAASTPTRLDQIETLLDRGDLGILAGDLNAEPGWPEIERFEAAGLVSAQDALGDPALLTSPTPVPRYRIDWVFAPAWSADDTLDVLADTPWSDHAPLVLRHRVPAGG